MTLPVIMVDAEDVAKAWLLTTSVSDLVNGKIFLAMPVGSPPVCVILSRVGGAPRARSTVGEDVARISFSCRANDRNTAKQISKTLVSELESLAYAETVVTAVAGIDGNLVDARLEAAETLSWIWLPDPVSDKPRYIVDALLVTHA